MSITQQSVQELAERIGWTHENQLLWLGRKGYGSWSECDQGTLELATDMMNNASEMFSGDGASGLSVYEGEE